MTECHASKGFSCVPHVCLCSYIPLTVFISIWSSLTFQDFSDFRGTFQTSEQSEVGKSGKSEKSNSGGSFFGSHKKCVLALQKSVGSTVEDRRRTVILVLEVYKST